MFLQKHRRSREAHLSPSPNKQSTRLEQVVKKLGITEIKSHTRGTPKVSSRSFLIDYTHKLFRQQAKKEREPSLRHPASFWEHQNTSRPQKDSVHLFVRDRSEAADFTRESRTAAARIYREKINKRNDITPFMRAQQELAKSRQTEHLRFSYEEDSPAKIVRYQDLIEEFSQEIKAEKKEARSNWIANRPRPPRSVRPATSKNPQVQVTNIQFVREQEPPSKMLVNRERRREMVRRPNHFSFSSHGKRPSKAVAPHPEDNFIEPW